MDAVFDAYVVDKEGRGAITAGLARCPIDELKSPGVLIRVQYSSLNYKDALAARGEPGIVKRFPHVPGIDAAGVRADDPAAGAVLVTGYGLGTEVWGGYGDYIRVPDDWIIPIPAGLTARDSMVLGTAGLTAALCVDALLQAGLDPARGEILVTGATGGVGTLAISLLVKLGFTVAALTRKPAAEAYLRGLGVARVVAPTDGGASDKALHKAQWAAAIDTVGGEVLADVLKAVGYGGAVAACGMAAGTRFQGSVFPFILRGVRLLGIDSVQCPRAVRDELWARLAGPWRLSHLADIEQVVDRQHLGPAITALLQGTRTGRTLVVVTGEPA